MAKVPPPSKTEKKNQSNIKATDMTPPGEEVMLQLKLPVALKNEFKAYTALSPYKTMPQLFAAMFEEYKNNHPV